MNKQQLIANIEAYIHEIEAQFPRASRSERGQLIALHQNAETLLGRINTPEMLLSIEEVRDTDMLETASILTDLAAASDANQIIVKAGNTLIKNLRRYGIEEEVVDTEKNHQVFQYQAALAQLHKVFQYQAALAQLHTELQQRRPLGISNHHALDGLQKTLNALHAIDLTDIHAVNQQALVYLKALMDVKAAAETPKDIEFIYRIQAYSDPVFGALSHLSTDFPTLKTIQNEEDLLQSIAEAAENTTALLEYAETTICHFCSLYLDIQAFQRALDTWQVSFNDTTLIDAERQAANEVLREAYTHFQARVATPDAQALIQQNQGLTKALNALILTVNALLWLVGLNGFQKISREKAVSSIEHNLSLFKNFTDSDTTDTTADQPVPSTGAAA